MRVEPAGPVVVGVEASTDGTSAIELAADEASGRMVPLVVALAVDPHPVGRGRPTAEQLLGSAVSRALADHPMLSVTVERLSGEPCDALVVRLREASLVVVTHRTRCDSSVTGVSSLAHLVVSRSAVPVLVHRPLYTADQLSGPVLAGVACATGDYEVLEFAFEEASRRGGPVLAVHICRGCGERQVHGSVAGWRDEADRKLVDALRPWSEKYPDVTVEQVIRHGLDVSVSLTAASRSARLVVVGDRHREGGAPLLSVAQVLAHRAGCPVAVVSTG